MGDVAMLVQSVWNVLENNPEVKITLVTRPLFQVFFGHHERLSFHEVDLKSKHKGLLGLLKLTGEIFALKPDVFIDEHDVLRSSVVRNRLKLGGIKIIIFEKGRKEKSAMLNGQAEFKQLPHSIQRYNNALKIAGLNIKEDYHFRLPTSEHEFKTKPKNKVIGFAPFAAHESKEWGLENVKAFLKLLEEDGHYEVLLFGGGKKEIRQIKELTFECSCAKSVAGQFSLEEELAIMKSCEVFIAMDSSNMHLADLVGCKVISIWVATHPYFGFYAWNNKNNSIVLSKNDYAEIPLSIFGKISEKDTRKVEDIRRMITPEVVLNKIVGLID